MRKDEFAVIREIKLMGMYEVLNEMKEEIEKKIDEEIERDSNNKKALIGGGKCLKSIEGIKEGILNILDGKIKALEAEAEKDV